MTDHSILLIIGGGIAAYKSLELIRELSRRRICVRCILTRAGSEFVTPLSVSSLSGEKCYTDLFNLTDETEMGHIELSRSADLVVVAPATADLMAKAANGLANDLASTTLLATDKPVLYAPAMNVRMWEHPATNRNISTLKADGAEFVGPGEGAMACGEFGEGRMAEPIEIADAVEQFFLRRSGQLSGQRVLVTAGPTHEPIDPVRYIANRSSGRQGYAIAAALRDLGAQVALVTGPTSLSPPVGVEVIRIETAQEMMDACMAALPVEVAVCCAAVGDYRPATAAAKKLKKEHGGIDAIALAENPDILKTLSQMKSGRPRLVVGFAAETNDIVKHAKAKLARKACDFIVANDVSPGENSAMGGASNTVTLISAQGVEEWPQMTKVAVAERLAMKIAEDFVAQKSAPRAAE